MGDTPGPVALGESAVKPGQATSSDKVKETDGPSSAPGSEESSVSRDEGASTAVEAGPTSPTDPLGFGRHRHNNVTRQQMSVDHPKGNPRKLKRFYFRQNELIDQFLGVDDEERLQVEEDIRMAPKIRFAVNASFIVNFCLFVIQLYAALSTGSLSVNQPCVLYPSACEPRVDPLGSYLQPPQMPL